MVIDNCRLVVDKEPAIEFSSALGGGVESIGGTLSVECGGKVAPFDFGMFAAKNRPDQDRRKAFGG